MTRFAENTSVSTDRSRAEIERILRRYGANGFLYGWQDRDGHVCAMVSFEFDNRVVRFLLPLPSADDQQFTRTPAGRRQRSPPQAQAAWEQACRQSWRALALVIKAKLEAVEAGITTFNEEFLAHIVLPSGQSIGQFVIPRLDEVYRTGQATLLLPGPSRD